VRLGPGRGLDGETSCIVLQSVLRQRQGGGSPLGVDGNCGPATQDAVAALATAAGCGEGIWSARGACLLNREIAPERAAECAATWPFTRACRWTAEEADALLALLRRAASETAALEPERWDLAAGTAAAVLPDELAAEDGRQLVDLARRVARLETGSPPWDGEGVPPPAPLGLTIASLQPLESSAEGTP
jgi:hypothetical protein